METSDNGKPEPLYEIGTYVQVSQKISETRKVYLWMREYGPDALRWQKKHRGWLYLAVAVPEKGFQVDAKGFPIVPTSNYFDLDETEIERKL